MDDLTFLEQLLGVEYDFNNATLKAVLPDGQVDLITDRASPYRLLDSCPLLYHAFEYGHQNRLQASIEAPSKTAVIALLRYCYTNSYLPPDAEYAPIMFLPHAHVYKMAEDFDIPELQLLAHGNFSCQVDFACSLPEPPHDLLETIRYVYTYFASPESRQQQGLLHTLLNYCISVFQYHKLGESAEFLEVVRQIPEFRQDLCRTNMARNFQDDCALEIVQLALDTLQPQPSIRPTLLASRDLPEEMLIDRPPTPTRTASFDPVYDAVRTLKAESKSDGQSKMGNSAMSLLNQSGSSMLALRPKHLQSSTSKGFETDSSSDEDGFMMVHRPKPQSLAPPETPRSSPFASTPKQQLLAPLDAPKYSPFASGSKPDSLAPPEAHKLSPFVSASKQQYLQPPHDYETCLKLVEYQNKNRLLAARKAQDELDYWNNRRNMPSPEVMSSPEIIPSNPEKKTVDVLALTGSKYPDDDDWTML